MVFNERLAELRKETGLNQKEFADSLGIEASKYNKWENGKNNPDFDTVCWFADRFNTTTDFLLGRTDARNPENKALMDEFGLSELSIENIIGLRTWNLRSSQSPEDDRTYQDILDALLRVHSFLTGFLLCLGKLTDPSIKDWENFKYIDDLDGPGYTAESAYRSRIHEELDNVIEEIKNKKWSRFLRRGDS